MHAWARERVSYKIVMKGKTRPRLFESNGVTNERGAIVLWACFSEQGTVLEWPDRFSMKRDCVIELGSMDLPTPGLGADGHQFASINYASKFSEGFTLRNATLYSK